MIIDTAAKKTRRFRAIVAGLATVGLIGFVATPADAAVGRSVRPDLLCKTQFVANGVRIHLNASTSSTVMGLGYDGQWFYVQNLADPSGTVFAYGTDESTGVVGYVYDTSAYLNIHECP